MIPQAILDSLTVWIVASSAIFANRPPSPLPTPTAYDFPTVPQTAEIQEEIKAVEVIKTKEDLRHVKKKIDEMKKQLTSLTEEKVKQELEEKIEKEFVKIWNYMNKQDEDSNFSADEGSNSSSKIAYAYDNDGKTQVIDITKLMN